MGNKKREPNLSAKEEKDLIFDLMDKGFPQENISQLFGGKYKQSKISNMKQKRDSYNQGSKDKEDEIKTRVFEKVLENRGKATPLIITLDGDIE